jgi:hypothetical protein
MLRTNGITSDNGLTITGNTTFTTNPRLITQNANTNSTSGATTEYVDNAIQNLKNNTNTWTNQNTFNTITTNGITLSGTSQITLGNNSSLPTLGQMGGVSTALPTLTTTIGQSNTSLAVTPVFYAGTYIIMWSVPVIVLTTTTNVTIGCGNAVGSSANGLTIYTNLSRAGTTMISGFSFYTTTVSIGNNLTLWGIAVGSNVTASTTNYKFNWMRIS